MLLTLTFLIVAQLHFTQPTVVTTFHQPDLSSQSIKLQPQATTGIPLQPAHLTIVKTWAQ